MNSEAIVNTMELLEITPINELTSEATIKVCYVSDEPNRNKTVITKEVGKIIASSLPGAPVVAFFDKEKNDFGEHNRKLTFKNGKVEFEEIGKPYGFVSPSDKPWYQDFEEDGQTRTYLMCKAFLWTKQYEEANLIFGKGQSMELDESSMSGYYSGDFFIFNSVTIDRLCILGDAFVPCFGGAKVMSKYAKQYTDWAKSLEEITGRRYYIMDNKLKQKNTPIALSYALELGWQVKCMLEKLVQKTNFGCGFYIEEIYCENNINFAILKNYNSQELFRWDFLINSEDDIELKGEPIPVKLTWTPKIDEPAVAVATYTTIAVEPAVEPVVTVTEPAVEPATEPAAEPAVEPAIVTEPAVEPAIITEPVVETVTEPVVEPAVEPATIVTEPVVTEPAVEPAATVTEPAATVTEPATTVTETVAEPATTYAALEAKLLEYTAELVAKDATITELQSKISKYQVAENAAIEAQKDELLTSYTALLDASEIAPVSQEKSKYTLDEIESKLSVMYTRKQRANSSSAPKMQVNIASTTPAENLPSFILQAKEYDKARAYSIPTIK